MAFELQSLSGETTRGETALRAGQAALMMILAGLIKAGQPKGNNQAASPTE